MSVDKPRLRKSIMSAFTAVPYPGDDRLGDPNGRDDGETVTELFRGQDWRSLQSAELWPGALYWMTPEAYHYYFPAYLLAATGEVGGDIIDVILHRLTPPSDTDKAADNFQERYRRFSPAQKQVVRDFLDFKLEDLMAYQRKTNRSNRSAATQLRTLRDFWDRFESHV